MTAATATDWAHGYHSQARDDLGALRMLKGGPPSVTPISPASTSRPFREPQ